ncbi:hypothetical protein NM208_g5352 [Fusarium decemcellulare]|uniref:Uncharacterized protein n=1 Tax=Fusarium decemcellulare TaxID=57161 RepID=A0ACC1SHB4_9HYPO|nr:hypothetical protein NM208_g5352 [Fusarium decemcellulare]
MDFIMADFGSNDSSSAAFPGLDHQDEVALVSSTRTASTDAFNMPSQSHDSEDFQSYLKQAMDFCATLIEEYHSFRSVYYSPTDETVPESIERPIQRALDHTSRLLEILEGLTAPDIPPHQRRMSRQSPYATSSPHSSSAFTHELSSVAIPTSISQQSHGALTHGSILANHVAYDNTSSLNSNSSNMSSSQEGYDILLTSTLVTSYAYLIRTWRSVFSLLHRLLLTSGAGPTLSLLKLPSLQFGGFQLVNNPSIQIQVLFELRNDLFQRIEGIMGIGNSTTHGRYRDGKENKRQVLGMDPCAVLIRETLLHQERVRATNEDGMGDLSLKDITTKVKQLLDTQS